ncbi:MAG: bifunctional rhamnulose-1-phosphate aldolase/short-chain dehydrogenase [Elusimicrobia bacterium]|nr:bifunctional rhamnulose-1-phosphate aldolase/short-chain dehydrogenase [Elusimicrobiota bacterium]
MTELSRSLWRDGEAKGLSGPELCAWVSRLIGADTRMVLWGGGNSSIKTLEKDHAGREVRTLWVKASGFDMKSIVPAGFAPLRLEELLLARSREAMTDEEMVAYQTACLIDPKAAKPSIETLLHAFIPAAHVYHTHADAVAGLTCTPDSQERVRKVFGPGVLWVPYRRPGFELSKLVAREVSAHPEAWALVLDKHGVLTWGEEAREAYDRMIQVVRRAARAWDSGAARIRGDAPEWGRARVPGLTKDQRRARALEVLPWLRGEAGKTKRVVVRWSEASEALDYVSRPEIVRVSQRGPFAPDQALAIKGRPLLWTGSTRRQLAAAFDGYRKRTKENFRKYAPRGAELIDAEPRVALVPGVGIFSLGKNWKAAGMIEEIFGHNAAVQRRVAAVTTYRPVDLPDLCGIEFWPMETYKYKLQPPEKEFSRRVVLVTGAAGAIGAATAARFAEAGAHVVLADLDLAKAKALEARIDAACGLGRAFAVRLDVGDEASVRAAFEEAVLRYGGIDILFSNAGIAKSAPVAELSLDDWERNLRVNATGHFLCSREAARLLRDQGTGGSIIFNASKNVLAPGKAFAAYSASKAAEVQLARVLAIEAADFGVRVNMVNPDAVFEGSGLWSPEMRRGRAKAQGIAVSKLEEHYAQRNLLKTRVTALDVAEAVLFLASERSAKTTGAMLPVDGGLREAFPR